MLWLRTKKSWLPHALSQEPHSLMHWTFSNQPLQGLLDCHLLLNSRRRRFPWACSTNFAKPTWSLIWLKIRMKIKTPKTKIKYLCWSLQKTNSSYQDPKSPLAPMSSLTSMSSQRERLPKTPSTCLVHSKKCMKRFRRITNPRAYNLPHLDQD